MNLEVKLKPWKEDSLDHHNSGETKHPDTSCNDKEKLHKKFPASGNCCVEQIYDRASAATEAIATVIDTYANTIQCHNTQEFLEILRWNLFAILYVPTRHLTAQS